MNPLDPLLLLISLLGSAFYSGMETGVVSINRLRLQHLIRRRAPGAETIRRFLDNPDLLLGTTLLGNNLCNVVIAVTSASLAVSWLGPAGLWVASLASTLVLLLFGEYLPKAWFRSYPAFRVLPYARLLSGSGTVFYPVSMGIMQLADWLVPGAKSADQSTHLITREELAYLAKEGEQAGTFSAGEREMVRGVLDLQYTTCADLMVPRKDIATAAPAMPVETVLKIARERRISRLPIYDPETRSFTGLIYVMDVLMNPAAGKRVAKDYARPPQFVGLSDRVDQVLPRMRFSRQPMALVRDPSGQVAGLITTEDILEKIVGQL
jgi:putative hemolysin